MRTHFLWIKSLFDNACAGFFKHLEQHEASIKIEGGLVARGKGHFDTMAATPGDKDIGKSMLTS